MESAKSSARRMGAKASRRRPGTLCRGAILLKVAVHEVENGLGLRNT